MGNYLLKLLSDKGKTGKRTRQLQFLPDCKGGVCCRQKVRPGFCKCEQAQGKKGCRPRPAQDPHPLVYTAAEIISAADTGRRACRMSCRAACSSDAPAGSRAACPGGPFCYGCVPAGCAALIAVQPVKAVAAYKKLSQNRSGLAQGKEMVIAELSGTADILGAMASEIRTGFGFDTVKEARIKELLGYAGILVSDVAIYGSGNEGVTLVVRKKDAAKKEIKEVLSSVVGEELTESEKTDGVGGTVNLTFRQAPSYGLLYGESSFSAQGECGDSRQTVKLSYDKIMFILSDGMGTGAAAEETADSAVKLIKSFYLAGFDHKTVFGCVAKLLSLRKKEDFSALDVVICDTQTGEFDFIKQGGRESYVVSGGNVEVIEGCSLPLGIIEESDPQVVHRRMRGGDTVIVISDGIADRLNYNDVTELLSEIKTTNPQVIAEKVTAAAAQKEGNKDDMTAIVIRLVKNR